MVKPSSEAFILFVLSNTSRIKLSFMRDGVPRKCAIFVPAGNIDQHDRMMVRALEHADLAVITRPFWAICAHINISNISTRNATKFFKLHARFGL